MGRRRDILSPLIPGFLGGYVTFGCYALDLFLFYLFGIFFPLCLWDFLIWCCCCRCTIPYLPSSLKAVEIEDIHLLRIPPFSFVFFFLSFQLSLFSLFISLPICYLLPFNNPLSVRKIVK